MKVSQLFPMQEGTPPRGVAKMYARFEFLSLDGMPRARNVLVHTAHNTPQEAVQEGETLRSMNPGVRMIGRYTMQF